MSFLNPGHKIYRIFLPAISLLTALQSPTSVMAQDAAEPAAEDQLVMNMPNLDIRSLIQWAADYLDKNIVVHRSVQGTITILSQNPVSREEAWELFLTALEVNGFTVVETGDVTRVIPDTEAIQTDIPLQTAAANPNSAEMIIKLIKVNNIAASQVVTILTPLIPDNGHISAFDQGNTLIVADYASNLSRIESIIESIDQASNIDVEIIPMENASASEVISILNTLVNTPGGSANLSAQVALAADQRTNSILMSGDVAKRQQMRGIIAGLDRPIVASENTKVIYIHYLAASDLQPIVQAVMESVQNDRRNEASTEIDINIEATDAPNALIITAPPEIMEAAESVITRLDIRRAQVLVEAIIVEVNQDNVDELGVLWGTSGENIGGDGQVTTASTLGGSLTDALNTEGGNLNVNLLGNGFTLGYYRDGSLRGLLRALETDSAANILSTPSIVTLDNEEAEIIVGSNVPFLTGSRETLGSSSLFNTIERRDIGITLKIKPQINNGDSITLTINQTAESVSDRAQAADIQTDKREINTKVIIYDGNILVLGGLIKDGVTESENKIPLLGDIPFAGKLFRGNKSSSEKKNLMVFIHASILRDQVEGDAISMERYNSIREQQQTLFEDADINSEIREGPVLPEYETYTPGSSTN